MVRVLPAAVLAGFEPGDPGVEVVEGDGEVPRVPSGGLEAEARGTQVADANQRQDLEADQGRLLRQFVDRGVASREHRDAVLAVDRVVALPSLSRILRHERVTCFV
jgi:hypothetical protein